MPDQIEMRCEMRRGQPAERAQADEADLAGLHHENPVLPAH